MKKNELRYFSMYSGVGGFEYGIQQTFSAFGNARKTKDLQNDISNNNNTKWRRAPAVCVGYSEIDKWASAVYKYNYGTDIKNYGDADEINAEELPDFDLLVGGFPCQAFSVAGKRRGFDDTRGTQFFNVARIAQQKQPRLLVLENVKGLLSHDKGQTFHTIITTLDELGYDVEWQVLNSKNHGVPQNRERVFIIGRLRGRGGQQIFPFKRTNRENNENFNQIIQLNNPKHSQQRVYDPNGISPTIAAGNLGGGKSPSKVVSMTNSETLRIRKLTPLECERLQGFPDDWTKYGIIDGKVKEMSNTQRYKMMGNAVTTNVVRDVMVRLLDNE